MTHSSSVPWTAPRREPTEAAGAGASEWALEMLGGEPGASPRTSCSPGPGRGSPRRVGRATLPSVLKGRGVPGSRGGGR